VVSNSNKTKGQPLLGLHLTLRLAILQEDTAMQISTIQKFFSAFFLLASLVFTFDTAHCQSTSAGTSIFNRATLSFLEDGSSTQVSIDSNTVSVVVQSVESLLLTPNNNVNASLGSQVALAHQLINTGNTNSNITLSLSNAADDDYDLTDLQLINDVNGNGMFDSGEPASSLTSLPLAQRSVLNLIVVGNVPASAGNGRTARLNLTASTALQSVSVSNVDTIRTSNALELKLAKTASTVSALPGDVVSFTLTGSNTGIVAPNGVAILIDGVPSIQVIVRDAIPVNTTFSSAVTPQNGVLLYHLVGSATHTYTLNKPSDLQRIDAIAVAYSGLAPQSVVTVQFTIRINENASGNVYNQGRIYFVDPLTSQVDNIRSNEVEIAVPETMPWLNFYGKDTYEKVTSTTAVGRPIYVQIVAARCNLNSSVAESIRVVCKSQKTGDTEEFDAIEVGPNSGVFRIPNPIPTHDVRNHAIQTNGIIETSALDTLTATADCNGAMAINNLLVDPRGVVFDSRTNAPIAGATVTLIDVTGAGNGGNAGGPATVIDFDGVTPAASTLVTSEDGTFIFPLVAPSTYRYAITVPPNYSFPSQVPVNQLPVGRVIDAQGSYGGNFAVTGQVATVIVDVPLDADLSNNGGLFIEKTASRRQAEVGDFIDYRIRVRNSSESAITNIVVNDILPPKFIFVKGSVRRNGSTIADPAGNTGPRLSYSIGDLAVGEETVFLYRLRIGVGARSGDAKNRANASGISGSTSILSNNATATVRVGGGIFDSKGILIGRVFVDTNKDGIVNEGEQGIPGVRLYLEDGTFVITDGQGMYDVYGLSARTHVIKVDRTTLPTGSILAPLGAAYANKGDSAFVDLKIGELHKVNFAEVTATPAILKEVAKRRDQISKFGEVNLAINRTLESSLTDNTTPDKRSLPPSGIINTPNNTETLGNSISRFQHPKSVTTNIAPTAQFENTGDVSIPSPALVAGNSNLPELPIRSGSRMGALSLPEGLNSELGFVDFKNGDTLAFDQANVRIKGGLESKLTLKLNGDEIDSSRIGSKVTLPENKVSVWEYIGVRFKAGSNLLEVSDGSSAIPAKLNLIVPGNTGKIEVTVPKDSIFADAKTFVPIQVRLVDGRGTPVSARTPLTLELTKGSWQVTDLNTLEPGVQVFVQGGTATFNLLAPSEPGDALIRVSSGILTVEKKISFVPELRSLIAAGLVDAKVNLFGFKPRGGRSVATSEFEEELRGFTSGNGNTKARGALFAKGQIQGKYLLTMRYDSQRATDERLFRDIQPDEYYPVYGDDSVKGYDAQSSSRLYIRIDDQKSYLLYGDYVTSSSNEARSLGEYNRSLNGIRAHHENDKVSANFFVAHDNSTQNLVELRGRGISGPYVLGSSGNISDGSEKVEIIVRDRNQPSVILSVTAQTRFADYQIDSRTNGILFNRPVPSVDSNLNPIFIRVSFEINQGGPRFTVAGIDAQVRVAKNLEVGAAMVQDENPENRSKLRSLNATFQITEGTTLIGEWAQSDTNLSGRGDASRLELTHQSDKLTARAFVGKSDIGFNNPASVLSAGRKEASMKATYKVSSQNLLKAEAIKTEDVQTGGNREGAQLSLEHTFDNQVRLEVGLRHAKETNAPAQPTSAPPVDFTSLRAKLTTPVPNQPRANVFAEYEQDINDSSKKAIALGGDYQLNERSRLYLRHELISSLSGRYALNDIQDQHATLVGIDMDYAKDAHVFSEYRINNGIAGREAEAAIGLRNLWQIANGVRVNTSFERINGNSENKSTAITGSIEYTRLENLKATLRLEGRNSSAGNTILATAGAAYKMNNDVTLLAKGVLNSGSGENANRIGLYDRLLFGAAYRDSQNDRLNALAKFEWRRGRPGNTTFGEIVDSARLVSLNANYRASRRLVVSGHYAAKWAQTNSNNLKSSKLSQLASGRLTRELDHRSNLSLMASFATKHDGNKIGLGLEYNRAIRDNLWLGLGYNHSDIDDADLLEADGPGNGFYIRLRWKFDENIFGRQTISNSDSSLSNSVSRQAQLPMAVQ
jgi:uncharacterized repeat protein (TIGR01451 family)